MGWFQGVVQGMVSGARLTWEEFPSLGALGGEDECDHIRGDSYLVKKKPECLVRVRGAVDGDQDLAEVGGRRRRGGGGDSGGVGATAGAHWRLGCWGVHLGKMEGGLVEFAWLDDDVSIPPHWLELLFLLSWSVASWCSRVQEVLHVVSLSYAE